MIDTRREANQIARHFTRHHTYIGEALLWYLFNANASQYDEVYDEAYRQYEPGRKVPILWVDQQEASVDYSPEGRRPTQRIRFACGSRQLWEAGIQVNEGHGNRLQDTSPSVVWREDRLNDILYYDGRFYRITGFQIKGRIQDQDTIIGISGIETFPTDELNLDTVPPEWFPWVAHPEVQTTVEDALVILTTDEEPPTSPDEGDLWFVPDQIIEDMMSFGPTPPSSPMLGAHWVDTSGEERSTVPPAEPPPPQPDLTDGDYAVDSRVSYGPNPPEAPEVGEYWMDESGAS